MTLGMGSGGMVCLPFGEDLSLFCEGILWFNVFCPMFLRNLHKVAKTGKKFRKWSKLELLVLDELKKSRKNVLCYKTLPKPR